MARRLLALVAAAGAVAWCGPADAALPRSRPLVVADVVGDANAVNGQGLLTGVPDTSTPTSQPAYDLVSFSLSRLDDRKRPTHLVGKLVLAAAPTGRVDVRIKMSAPGCTVYYLELEWSQLGQSYFVRNNCPAGPTSTFEPVSGRISGRTVVWTVPIKELPGRVKAGTPLRVKGAQVSLATAVIFPALDEVVTDKTYWVGQ